MKKILVICGPTATGKTALALSLAKIFDGEVISADSRQVYIGMDIGTGKDLPNNARKFKDHYEISGIKLWGYDLVDARAPFSVAQYVTFAKKTIKKIINRGHIPILVGGTGLYIKGVIDGIETAYIPRNIELRKNLVGRAVSELFESLAQLDPIKAASLNASDKLNPRRLVRAIEVSQWELNRGRIKKGKENKFDTLFIGLTAPKETLFASIDKRVKARIKQGFVKEVKKLLKGDIDWEFQSMSSLGYRQLREYFEGRLNLADALDLWGREEKKYVKRQLTWWKHDQRINWFNITGTKWPEKVEKMVKIWYSTYDAKKN
jgi:tRNA dimethylallyltransferase